MTSTTIAVPGIHCENCSHSIEGALRPLPGVQSADVDIEAKVVHVTYESPASLNSLREAIEEQGYDLPATN